jgi:hypothetical protein
MNGAESPVDTRLAGGAILWFANPGTSEMQFVAVLDAPPLNPMIAVWADWVSGLSRGILRSRVAPDWLVAGPQEWGRDLMQDSTFIGLDVRKRRLRPIDLLCS